ncbi:MAG: tetratricopeptide repeat protein [Phycisphaerae bacterium]
MRRLLNLTIVGFAMFLASGCVSNKAERLPERNFSPLFEGMGSHSRQVTTVSTLGQRYFDQGLNWYYAFNHDEAIRSFTDAAKLDPNCPMAWWGIAIANGPHINNPEVPPDRAAAAWTALQKAIACSDRGSTIEQELIFALKARYADPQPSDRSSLDKAYADEMKKLWLKFPNDQDIGTLYAEALMDLSPWDLWTQDKQPKSGTEEIIEVLETVLSMDVNNPGANHLYIHAVEASDNPQRANAAADRLRRLMPGSGHMIHMPSHIDVLAGRWELAAKQNEQAMEIDAAYRKLSPRQGFYQIYMSHNSHMLSFASMMEGRHAIALSSAEAAIGDIPAKTLKEQAAFLDPYMGVVYDVHKRFGRWDAMLSEEKPASFLPITTTMWHFHRAVAFAAKGDVKGAERERSAFLAARDNVPADAKMAINKASAIFDIAEHFLNGEISFRKGEFEESIAHLRKAIEIEDGLLYMEPPEWVQPTRHTLGAVLLTAGRYREAEKVYREDLAKWPENGWSLYGLSRALAQGGDEKEAASVLARFHRAWKRSDSPIASSCLCIPKT